MPKARSAILSSLRGSLRGGPTFRDTTQTDAIVMQTRPVPTDRRTAKQAAVRDAYSRLAYLWSNLSQLDKEPYEIMAEARNLTPWNCWLSFHLPLMRLTPKFYSAFSEGAGTSLTDFAIDGIPGTINGPSWTQINEFPALSFDGFDDRVTFNKPNYYDAYQNFSTFFITSGPQRTPFATFVLSTKTAYSGTSGFGMGCSSSGAILLSYGDGSSSLGLLSTLILPMNQLNIWGIIKSGTSITFYLNGATHTRTAASGTVAPSNLPLFLGNSSLLNTDYLGTLHLVGFFAGVTPLSTYAALDAHFRPFFT